MRINRYFLTPYLILLFVPIIFEITVFIASTRRLGNNSLEYSFTILEQSSRTVEQRLGELDKISSLLIENVYLRHISFQEDPMEQVYGLYRFQKTLYDYQNVNAVLENYFVYFKKNQYVVNPHIAYRYDQFYGHIYQHDQMSSREWRSLILSRPQKMEILQSEEIRLSSGSSYYMTYIRRFPSYGENAGAVVMLIDEDKLMGEWKEKNGGDFLIVDEQGNILASSAGRQPFSQIDLNQFTPQSSHYESEDKLISYRYSEKYGFYFVSIQDRQTVFREKNSNTLLTVIIFTAVIMMGIPLAFIFALRNTEARKEIERKLEKEQKLLANIYMGQLISGEIILREEEITEQISSMQLPIPKGFYRVLLLELSDTPDEKWARNKLTLTSLIPLVYDRSLFIYDLKEFNRIVLIVETESERQDSIRSIIRILEQEIQKTLFCPCSWGIGDCCAQLQDLEMSFSQARQALQYKMAHEDKNLFFHEEMGDMDEYFYFPQEKESQLFYALQSGNKTRVEDIFRLLHEENFQKRHLSHELLNQFTLALWGTLLKASNQSLIESAVRKGEVREIQQKLAHYPPGRQFELLEAFFLKMTDSFKQKQKSGNSDLKDKLLEYILENFADEGLSLSTVGWHLKISEVYVSQFFKEQFGENFSTYINRLRMDRAKEILTSTDTPLKEIPSLVGYGSYNSFSRSFRRIHGISAGEYRKSAPKKDHF